MVAREVADAVDRWTWRCIAKQQQWGSLSTGCAMQGIRLALQAASTPAPVRSSIISVVTGALPTVSESRTLDYRRAAAQADSHESAPTADSHESAHRPRRRRSANPKCFTTGERPHRPTLTSQPPDSAVVRCPACLAPDPDYAHMWWECCITHNDRRQYWSSAIPSVPHSVQDVRLWQGRGLLPPVLQPARIQQPLRRDDVCWDILPPSGVLTGTLYTDGSAIHGNFRLARRGGWGLSMIADESSRISGAAYGPLPTFTQTAGCAELYAALMALRLSAPPIVIATDYELLIRGWESGPGSYTQPQSKSAECWKLFWAYVAEYGRDNITIRKVAAHKSFQAVQDGHISFRDWCGNHKADLMAKQGAAMHPCNSQLVQQELQQIQQQRQHILYLGWLNASLLATGASAVWSQHVTTDLELIAASGTERRSATVQASIVGVSSGNSGSAVFERAPDYQGDPHNVEACVLRLSPPSAALAPSSPSEEPQRAVSHETALVHSADSHELACTTGVPEPIEDGGPFVPGEIHPTHHMMQLEFYVFCGVCGVYAKQIRRSQLHLPCLRAPKNRYAKIARDKFLGGQEPHGRSWRKTQCPPMRLDAD